MTRSYTILPMQYHVIPGPSGPKRPSVDSWPPGQRGLLSRVRIPRQGPRRVARRSRGKLHAVAFGEAHPQRGLPSRVRLPRKRFQRTPGGQPYFNLRRGVWGENPPNIPISHKKKKEDQINHITQIQILSNTY